MINLKRYIKELSLFSRPISVGDLVSIKNPESSYYKGVCKVVEIRSSDGLVYIDRAYRLEVGMLLLVKPEDLERHYVKH